MNRPRRRQTAITISPGEVAGWYYVNIVERYAGFGVDRFVYLHSQDHVLKFCRLGDWRPHVVKMRYWEV